MTFCRANQADIFTRKNTNIGVMREMHMKKKASAISWVGKFLLLFIKSSCCHHFLFSLCFTKIAGKHANNGTRMMRMRMALYTYKSLPSTLSFWNLEGFASSLK